MASKPGILTDWPWTPLGNFKHVVLAPWVGYTCYRFLVEENKDVSTFLIFPLLLWRILHNQIWISLSRYRTAQGTHRIVDKGIEFDQVDREANWDDQILFNGILFYVGAYGLSARGGTHLPLWRSDGVIMTAFIHAGPVEFLYYWLHRALHHHFLYSRYHSHHHASIVTEPITSVIHPFAEHISYFALFAIPMLTTLLTRTASVASLAGYITYIDLMNNMGHCNFEFVPTGLFSLFPFLKFFMYTPSYHSLHHTKFRTNYSLFMPIYDHMYGTVDKTSDALYRSSTKRGAERPHVVHLTHLTTPDSVYHLRLGFAFLAARPHQQHTPSRYILWPITLWTTLLTWIYARTSFVVERNRLQNLTLQTWALPKYTIQYYFQWQRESINGLVEEAILDADKKGAKVISLGLLNQGEELNRYGEVYVEKHGAMLRSARVVDGSSLAVAIVINAIPKDTTEVALTGGTTLSKVARALAFVLCHKGIRVVTQDSDAFDKLKRSFGSKPVDNLLLSKSYDQKIWIVGQGLSEEDQKKAPKGTLFIPFSPIPPNKTRKDCFYHHTPAMAAPCSLENVDSCENWLPRRAMSASRVAGIVHALEGWEEHECGSDMSNIDKVWQAALNHGFLPLHLSPHAPAAAP